MAVHPSAPRARPAVRVRSVATGREQIIPELSGERFQAEEPQEGVWPVGRGRGRSSRRGDLVGLVLGGVCLGRCGARHVLGAGDAVAGKTVSSVP